MATNLLTNPPPILRVSSVLNRDTKNYGKKHLLDDSDETCWNSEQGSPQYIALEFADPVSVHSLHIMFQGGFAGKECEVLGVLAGQIGGAVAETESGLPDVWEKLMDFYPDDNNRTQVFEVDESGRITSWRKLRIVFKNSTDFYGRVTIYKLGLLGIRI
ncbi:galactose-binding domain-containing protein [Phlyctochytrium arcticum]|nr:galactose-binding domain-containing protein [Phlyctochytrium arcticum]